ncbi:MAG: helix-turn-helix domain-containing protein [Olleya sp.]
MSIGSNIKSKRLELGLSQEVLADSLHISQATLSNIEANKSIPDVILLQQIADALDTDMNSLIDSKTVVVNNNNQKGGVGYAEVVNQLSEKLILLYESQIEEKNKIINDLKDKLSKYEI